MHKASLNGEEDVKALTQLPTDDLDKPLSFVCLWVFRKILFSTTLKHKHQKGLYIKLDEDAHALFDTLGRLYYKKPAVAQQSRLSQQTKGFMRSLWSRSHNASSSKQDETSIGTSKENGIVDLEDIPNGTACSGILGRQPPFNLSENMIESTINQRTIDH
ncbi:MAG: hypothetical protein Q9160_009141 [Pyrenula sp. 1 TL-2023]